MINENQIIQDYIDGLSTYKTARKHSISPQNVSKVLNRHGVKARSRKEASALFHGRESIIDYKKVVQDYQDGMSISKVAEKHKCNIKTVNYILGHNDINARTPKQASAIRFGRKKGIDDNEVLSDLKTGMSRSQVAEKHGCHYATVCRIIKKTSRYTKYI